MSKYLILNFKNAKLFRKFDKEKKNRKCDDFVSDGLGGYISRDYLPAFVEPITVHQVSNMLHVMFNERPVPSLRNSFYNKNEYYFEKAQNSYLKIDTPKISKNDYYYEKMHVKKAVPNSWNPSIPSNWEIVRKYIDNEDKFRIFVKKLNQILGVDDSESVPFLKIRNLVQNLPQDKRLDLYNTISTLRDITGLNDYFGTYIGSGIFKKPVECAITRKLNKTARMVNSGLESVIVLSGQIIVPVSQDDVERLRTVSKGCATILDGGLVTIDSLKDENNVSIDGFTQIKDISDEKTIPAVCD
jgi:hypothetical protein